MRKKNAFKNITNLLVCNAVSGSLETVQREHERFDGNRSAAQRIEKQN